MQSKTEQYVLDLPEYLHEPFFKLYFLIKENAPLVQEEFKYRVPFFSYKGLLAFISLTSDKKKLYIAFYKRHILQDSFELDIFVNTKVLKKWIYNSDDDFENQKDILKALLLQSLYYKDNKLK